MEPYKCFLKTRRSHPDEALHNMCKHAAVAVAVVAADACVPEFKIQFELETGWQSPNSAHSSSVSPVTNDRFRT